MVGRLQDEQRLQCLTVEYVLSQLIINDCFYHECRHEINHQQMKEAMDRSSEQCQISGSRAVQKESSLKKDQAR